MQANESQRREVAAVTITSIRFRAALVLQGAMSLVLHTDRTIERAISRLPAGIATL